LQQVNLDKLIIEDDNLNQHWVNLLFTNK
jgi:hypothetical protein